jgi:pyroglutamyl-peptidase
MKSVLITAFEPYDVWTSNASWLALVELVRERPDEPRIVTRRYPVDFQAVKERLAADLEADYDLALHLGQAPGAGQIKLEAFGVNMGGQLGQHPDDFAPLSIDGPAAYRSQAPLARWAAQLRAAGIPAGVSHHAGAYLCNATLYWAHYLVERRGLRTVPAFVHLPLDTSQVIGQRRDLPSLPASAAAEALRIILADFARGEEPPSLV